MKTNESCEDCCSEFFDESPTGEIELKGGNWKKGIAFDYHTLSSEYLGVDENGHDQWENTRSEMGELVYQLKYRNNTSVVQKIVELLDRVKGIEKMDYIVPIPPTAGSRPFQPVSLIAEALGKRRSVRVLHDLLHKKTGGAQLKNVEDPEERQRLLRESMTLSDAHEISGKKILLVDDLYRSGATLTVATDLLLLQGRAACVCVLTMTKTRSMR
jgi:predicted amidophosphoribosyltransferase